MTRLWNNLLGSEKRNRRSMRYTPNDRSPLYLEQLEARELLSLSTSLQSDAAGHWLFVSATGGETIKLSCKNDVVKLNGKTVTDGGTPVACSSLTRMNIYGGTGNNTIDLKKVTSSAFPQLEKVSAYGEGGNDTIHGTDSSTIDEELFGEAGNDKIYGNGGNDRLDGGAGNDKLYGHDGNDVMTGGFGDDTLDGGNGHDKLRETANVDFVLTNASLTGVGNDELVSIERARLEGGPSANLIDAAQFSGKVTLMGQQGKDTLIGGHGDDLLIGSHDAAQDVLIGGPGADTFRTYGFHMGPLNIWVPVEPEDIEDYQPGVDVLQKIPVLP